ncbi:MAG: hypothetical protein WAN50_01580 [Minisyncoccia bacterium]
MKQLAHFKASVKSGDGEDGVIEEIFNRIGARSRVCVEFGALNGTHHSNTWNLINNKGWHALLIEADRTYFEKLQTLYEHNPSVQCLNSFVSFEGENSLDAIFTRAALPRDFDLMSVDIDGNDYHVWESMQEFKPRVVIIEFNPTIPNDISFIQPRDMQVQQGSSLRALAELGKKKGYVLASVIGSNAFFVSESDFVALHVEQESLEALNPDTTFYTRLFQLYDGTLVLDGYKNLLWRRIPIDEAKLQVLPPRKRVFRSGISADPFKRRLAYYVRRSPAYELLKALRNLFR